MRLQKLTEYLSSEKDSQVYYSAELVEDGRPSLHIVLNKSSSGDWTAYNEKTDILYPVSVVGKSSDIRDWKDGDEIVLGVAIPRTDY